MFKSAVKTPDTYYLSSFSNAAKNVPIVNKEYDKRVGPYGQTFLQTGMLSDRSKLGLLQMANKVDQPTADRMQSTFQNMNKAEKFHSSYLTPQSHDSKFLHELSQSNGGKYRKTNSFRKRRKSRRNKKSKTKT